MTDPNATWPRPADEPRSQPFQPVSYDFEPEYTPPQALQPPPPAYPQPQPQAYPQPQPQPPGYAPPQPVYAPPPPPPVYRQPTFPGVPPQAAPPKRSRRGLKITLSIVGAVVVLCGIGTCVAGIPIIENYGRTVTAPDELPGGLTKTTDADMQSTVNDLKTELNASLSTSTAVAGYYNAPNGHPVLLAGASTIVLAPGTAVDDAFKGLNSTLPVTNVQPYPAGTLGGTVKCGTSTTTGIKLALCIWADHGTVGIGALFARNPADAAPLFVQIRETAETK